MKKRVAFVDHSFKKKSKSSDFFKKLLSKKFLIKEFWDERWRNGKLPPLNLLLKGNYHQVFFFQILPPPGYLKKLENLNLVWVPMFDSEKKKSWRKYLKYFTLKLKLISFSKALYKKFKRFGFETYYYQYFPEPKQRVEQTQKINIFFWMRTTAINWSLIKKVIGKNNISSITIKNAPDPLHRIELPPEKDIQAYNIKTKKGWLKKSKYKNLLSEHNVFIAPRRSEGIGLSFLEAMARGMAVVAVNEPTMNEYIKNNLNGYLYNHKRPKPIDLSDHRKVGQNAFYSIKKGYNLWNKKQRQLLKVLEKPARRQRLAFFSR